MAARRDLRAGLYFRDGVRLLYLIRVGPSELLLEDCWTLKAEELSIGEACQRLKLVRRSAHSPRIAA